MHTTSFLVLNEFPAPPPTDGASLFSLPLSASQASCGLWLEEVTGQICPCPVVTHSAEHSAAEKECAQEGPVTWILKPLRLHLL
jgi:hypothetical protein